jgi:hypothetical protein
MFVEGISKAMHTVSQFHSFMVHKATQSYHIFPTIVICLHKAFKSHQNSHSTNINSVCNSYDTVLSEVEK